MKQKFNNHIGDTLFPQKFARGGASSHAADYRKWHSRYNYFAISSYYHMLLLPQQFSGAKTWGEFSFTSYFIDRVWIVEYDIPGNN